MAKTCVTEKTARRQEWIEDGLLALMQTQKFEAITVTDLCRHLSLSRRSFYRYFRDLEDVLDSMLNRVFQDLATPATLPELDEFRKNFEFWYQHRAVLDALHHSGLLDKLYEFTQRYTDSMSIEDYLAPDDLTLDIHREAGVFATYGSLALSIAWYQDGFQKTPEEMAKIAHRLLFQPILQKT